MKVSSQSVGAVVVTYFPDKSTLEALVALLSAQVEHVVVVDNTPGESTLCHLATGHVMLLEQKENTGIASALNVGIRALLEQGCEYCLLSDQDSVPAADMVSVLLAATMRLSAAGAMVAATGPLFIDPRNGHKNGFPVFDENGVRFLCGDDGESAIKATFLISSGALLSHAVIEDVGLMEAGLFIDLVDQEWCFRAASRGYACYGVPAAQMTHTLGEKIISYKSRKHHEMIIHSPLRIYYQYRNFVYIYFRKYIPLAWKRHVLKDRLYQIYALVRFLPYPDNLKYLKSMAQGIFHGIFRRTGRL
jgi:rhamnosyltransferase